MHALINRSRYVVVASHVGIACTKPPTPSCRVLKLNDHPIITIWAFTDRRIELGYHFVPIVNTLSIYSDQEEEHERSHPRKRHADTCLQPRSDAVVEPLFFLSTCNTTSRARAPSGREKGRAEPRGGVRLSRRGGRAQLEWVGVELSWTSKPGQMPCCTGSARARLEAFTRGTHKILNGLLTSLNGCGLGPAPRLSQMGAYFKIFILTLCLCLV